MRVACAPSWGHLYHRCFVNPFRTVVLSLVAIEIISSDPSWVFMASGDEETLVVQRHKFSLRGRWFPQQLGILPPPSADAPNVLKLSL